MNILILSNCEITESQGSGYVIINTAKSLINMGYDVDIISPDRLILLSNWPASRARNYRMALGMGKWVYLNKKRLIKYSVIILYGAESSFAVFILKRILKLSIPVLLHSNGLETHVGHSIGIENKTTTAIKWYHFDQSWLFNFCYYNVDAILTVSKFDSEFAIKQLGISKDRVHFIEPCLPDIFFSYDGINYSSKKPIILYCGTWIARKGVNAIKEIIPDILRKHPEYNFRIIGVGHGFNSGDHFPADILDKVEVYPNVESKEEMIKLYDESSIFLFPSAYESFGLVVAEAMFCNCAVICGPTGFAADIKNNEEALVLSSLDAKEITQATEKLINNSKLREQLAVNGKKRTMQLKWSNYQPKLKLLIDALVVKRLDEE